ncbi:nuclease-related domain-containing protein [Candidatus Bathycorpusculum sp.]|uniref:nuclease-related domain-containing protein n=1 Tax=Candidatus Bathycorpusculum sp. TaxID=2994959 RepID=UPI0028371668|nr:NERD domain-containing protein [Candidatus Termitimicrobium sp.]MCL2431705.1 NERD domain-containing protein [Candidatus Termitimicrobium sp.]
MSFECNLLISVLKLTKNGVALTKDINTEAKLPSTVCMILLQKLQNENLIKLKNDTIETDSENRMQIAVKAITMGADIQRISTLLHWKEFEEIAAVALKSNGYTVYNNVRFKHENRRYEIDVIGCRKPLVVSIDCKHWAHTITPATMRKIAEEQTKRTKALAYTLPNAKLKLQCTQWEKAKFIPTILSLMPNTNKFYNKVPIVQILSLQDFINQLPLYIEDINTYSKKFTTLPTNSNNTKNNLGSES